MNLCTFNVCCSGLMSFSTNFQLYHDCVIIIIIIIIIKIIITIIIIIMIIIIISIFKEDNVFSINASLPYGPPVNTDTDYYQTFFRTCLFLQVLRYVFEEEKPLLAL